VAGTIVSSADPHPTQAAEPASSAVCSCAAGWVSPAGSWIVALRVPQRAANNGREQAVTVTRTLSRSSSGKSLAWSQAHRLLVDLWSGAGRTAGLPLFSLQHDRPPAPCQAVGRRTS
jgi:hypothetical protein